MGWAKVAGRNAAKYGVKYGPHAVAAWKIAGSQVEVAARQKMDEVSARRTAFDHADSVAGGSVLRVVDHGRALFVIFSHDEPVACYPEVQRPLPATGRQGGPGQAGDPRRAAGATAPGAGPTSGAEGPAPVICPVRCTPHGRER